MLKYKVIKNERQYLAYCNILEDLVCQQDDQYEDEAELLTLLIETYDQENNTLNDLNPIELLKELMSDHKLKAKDLVNILSLTKSTVSKILNYRKGLSKDTIRNLANYFGVSQASFNRPYKLIGDTKSSQKKA